MGQSMVSHVNYQFRNRAKRVAKSDLYPMMLEVEQRRSTLRDKPDRSEQEEQDLAFNTQLLHDIDQKDTEAQLLRIISEVMMHWCCAT